jgi:hypothetical protein
MGGVLGVLCGVLEGDRGVGDAAAAAVAVAVRVVREPRCTPPRAGEEAAAAEAEVEGRSREGVPRRGGEVGAGPAAAAAVDVLTPR